MGICPCAMWKQSWNNCEDPLKEYLRRFFFLQMLKNHPYKTINQDKYMWLNVTLNDQCKDVQNLSWFEISHKVGEKDIITKMKGFKGRNGIRWNQLNRKITHAHCDIKLGHRNKQNTNHLHIEWQIHFPNFTVAWARSHLGFVQKLEKTLPSSS